MLDAALCIPSTSNRLVVFLILVVQVISARFATIHTIKAHAIEVSERVGHRLEYGTLPVDATTAIALRSVRVIESLEATYDLADTRVVEDIVDWPSIALGEG